MSLSLVAVGCQQSESCGVTSSTEAEVSGWEFGFWHFVAIWMLIGLIVGCCEILCIIEIMRRKRIATSPVLESGPVVEDMEIDELHLQAELPMVPLDLAVESE
ncbi:hypothetical protein Q1695_008870 [Nippostrongylus brasiliensis]|nr:hypothetical protein Q1695_008870 [Nippostrongylus brasiliensis]